MKLSIVLILISVNISLAKVKFNGSIDYLQQDSKSIASNNNIEHIYKIYEDRKWIISISNAISVDLDCFKNEIKETNVFTTLKIEF